MEPSPLDVQLGLSPISSLVFYSTDVSFFLSLNHLFVCSDALAIAEVPEREKVDGPLSVTRRGDEYAAALRPATAFDEAFVTPQYATPGQPTSGSSDEADDERPSPEHGVVDTAVAAGNPITSDEASESRSYTPTSASSDVSEPRLLVAPPVAPPLPPLRYDFLCTLFLSDVPSC